MSLGFLYDPDLPDHLDPPTCTCKLSQQEKDKISLTDCCPVHGWPMKRTPLKRKTPLRSKGATLKRSKLKHKSDQRKDWTALYEAAKAEGSVWVRPVDCRYVLQHKAALEPHHIHGRVGAKILAFLWITPQLHKYIHDHSQWARRTGWLTSLYEGKLKMDGRPIPWAADDEEAFPDHLKAHNPDNHTEPCTSQN